nr:PREDICTED: uncharacterized protein LOC108198541 [Daucus carota subsp. sativus]
MALSTSTAAALLQLLILVLDLCCPFVLGSQRRARYARKKKAPSRFSFASDEPKGGLFGWVMIVVMISMTIYIMARKRKATDKDTDKGKGKSVGSSTNKKKAKGKGKGKGKGKTGLRDEPTDSETESEHNTREAEAEAEEEPARRVVRMPRSHSCGIFGAKIPTRPRRINISDGHIEDNEAKKTLLAIIRARWPLGKYTFSDIDAAYPKWLGLRVEEFLKYYRQLKGQSRSQAKAIIEDHIKVTIKRTMNELKRRIERKSREEGVSKLALKPEYWNIIFWKDLLKYWDTDEGHLHRSEVGAANRQRVERLHSAGARSFNRVRENMKKKLSKSPTKLEVWDECHTRITSTPESRIYTTPAAMRIAERYASILDRMPVEVTQTGERDEPWDWWMEAMEVPQGERPKKNYVVGFPKARASDLIPTLATRYRDSTRGGAGSSSSAPTQNSVVPDSIFLPIVRNVLNETRANPLQFARRLSDEEITTFARTALEASDPAADPARRAEWNNLLGGEVVHIVETLLEDVLQKMDARAKMATAQEGEKDYTDVDEETDENTDAEGEGEAGGEAGGEGGGEDGGESSDVSLTD